MLFVDFFTQADVNKLKAEALNPHNANLPLGNDNFFAKEVSCCESENLSIKCFILQNYSL